MPSKTTGPHGEMLLYEHWSETGSSHKETTETARLTVVDGKILLTLSSETKNFINQAEDRWDKMYEIGGRDLAELIQKNGKKA